MSRAHPGAIGGHAPWGAGHSVEELSRDEAPRTGVAYRCKRGHLFTVPMAADAAVPDTWEHGCGAVATREGSTVPFPAEVVLPAYGTSKNGRPVLPDRDTTPVAQLMKRRSTADLEALLAESLSKVQQQRGDVA